MVDRDLGEALSTLGPELVVPDVDLVDTVHEALATAPTRLGDKRRLPMPKLSAVAAAAVLVVGVSMTIAPVRDAVADLFGIGGTEIDVVDELPPADPPELPTSSTGSLEDEVSSLSFDAVLPDADRTGPPTAWEVRGTGANEELIIVFDDLVFSQRRIDDESITNRKLVDDGATSEPVEIDGGAGFWIEGTHVRIRGEDIEVATNVLLWEHHDLELRLEGAPDLETARAVAASVS